MDSVFMPTDRSEVRKKAFIGSLISLLGHKFLTEAGC